MRAIYGNRLGSNFRLRSSGSRPAFGSGGTLAGRSSPTRSIYRWSSTDQTTRTEYVRPAGSAPLPPPRQVAPGLAWDAGAAVPPLPHLPPAPPGGAARHRPTPTARSQGIRKPRGRCSRLRTYGQAVPTVQMNRHSRLLQSPSGPPAKLPPRSAAALAQLLEALPCRPPGGRRSPSITGPSSPPSPNSMPSASRRSSVTRNAPWQKGRQMVLKTPSGASAAGCLGRPTSRRSDAGAVYGVAAVVQ